MATSKGSIKVQANKKRARPDASSAKPEKKTVSSSGNTAAASSSGSDNEAEEDELDLEGISSGSELEEVESEDKDEGAEEEEGDDFPRKKKSKNSKHDDGSADFSSALSSILGSHLKAYDRKDPIMARNKRVLKQTEADKLEVKAKKAILAEKRKLLNKTRKKDILTTDIDADDLRSVLEKESKLRKIAQKGVVKLFNAILSTQIKTDKETTDSLSDIKNKQERERLITEVSKEKFLDLVKAAGNDD
ncbi:rRNA-processing protein RRP15 KNAG_0A07890 [Huiozyma naganishii CBS 8797]|uniref:Rrp15p-domain-containing protein n=1 Tax=Huiozyma naganishii (strain ATCC MYA-139 / BCRC 22969 / CBS 8797 / KCTC 17520 / NBRC 10181 / NCYC 3082 / Yp74L-3) TaxID=1071383 RepID=J7S487_HUIN7|nr:hypothetical protein KNAG_0A07890 [Kazachstania naganishii CBS 8797]CCK68441.1 hypothetical protein KNAG_0A07890 [Kazachstania naganishii CBS 8797]